MDNNIIRDNFKKVLDIKKVFENAKKDNGQTFLKEIKNYNKDTLEKIYEIYSENSIKVNKIRYYIINGLLNGDDITLEDIEKFKNLEGSKYKENIFRSWTTFSILYAIYYYYKKDLVYNILSDINNQLVKDLGLDGIVKTNIVDFNGAQNFGLENFWTAIYNNSHKSQKTAYQLNIMSFGNNDESLSNNLVSVGLGYGPEVKNPIKGNRVIFDINNITYESILDELNKYKDVIINDNYEINDKIYNTPINISNMIQNTSKILDTKKQIILFGPPGTGKTYSIKDVIEKHSNEGKTYEQLKKEGRVEFITFHQSFSYEEFIEGIKPELDGDSEDIKYKIEEGIFKKISNKFIDNIYSNSLVANGVIDSSKNFYKLSLGEYGINDDVYDYCISNNCISLGYGKDFDYTNIYNKVKDNVFNNKTVDQFKNIIKKEKIEGITPFDIQAIEYFIEFMKKGDYVFISKGNFKLRAIGKIVGDYEYSNDSGIEYKHFRKVEWLLKNVDIDVKDFFDRKFSQMSIYSLEKNGLNFDIINSYLSTKSIVSIDESTKKELLKNFYKKTLDERKELLLNQKKYYLVIDEINRGNISKIFGELITLLEADKRIGNDNELTTKLPYSKEEFGIPPNLYIVATMNTSDKSIVSLDTALRRRFGFVEMLPNYDLELLQKEIEGINLSDLLKKLNQRIEYLLDKDHLIGHSYFLKIKSIEDLKTVFYNEIIPLLEEYFYGEEEKIKLVIGDDFFEKNNKNYKEIFGKTDEDFDNGKNILKLKNIDSLGIDAIKKIINQVNNTKGDTENQ